MRVAAFLVAMVVAFAAYASPAVIQISPDTYMISKEDHGGIFGSMSKLKASVISQANQFAARQGKIAIPLTATEHPVGVLGHWASFEYQFRVVDKDDPEARRTTLMPRPDVVVEKTEKASVDVHTTIQNDSRPDTYTELLKLDDLRKKGILTEEEFQAEKAKLLNGRKDLIKDR